MRLLVTGAGGQVGWEVVRQAGRLGYNVPAFDRQALDITRRDEVFNAMRGSRAHVVVNCAAYTAVDQAEAEADRAFAINKTGPAHLADACVKARIPLVHISTDYVFDGLKQGPYVENDVVNPLGVYGRSKAAGEAEVRGRLEQHLILRTAWVYGVHGRNFVKTMLRLGREREEVRVVADQYGCPTSAADIAEAILKIAGCFLQAKPVRWGTYHYCGKGVVSWHGLAEQIFKVAESYARLKVRKVLPINTEAYPTAAKRPINSELDCALIKETFGVEAKAWQVSLAQTIHRLFMEEKQA